MLGLLYYRHFESKSMNLPTDVQENFSKNFFFD